jgi:hypothetical protein
LFRFHVGEWSFFNGIGLKGWDHKEEGSVVIFCFECGETGKVIVEFPLEAYGTGRDGIALFEGRVAGNNVEIGRATLVCFYKRAFFGRHLMNFI